MFPVEQPHPHSFGTFLLFLSRFWSWVYVEEGGGGGGAVVPALILIDLFRDVRTAGFSRRACFFIPVLLEKEAPSMQNEAAALRFK